MRRVQPLAHAKRPCRQDNQHNMPRAPGSLDEHARALRNRPTSLPISANLPDPARPPPGGPSESAQVSRYRPEWRSSYGNPAAGITDHVLRSPDTLRHKMLRRRILPRGNCWHTNCNPEAGQTTQRAAPRDALDQGRIERLRRTFSTTLVVLGQLVCHIRSASWHPTACPQPAREMQSRSKTTSATSGTLTMPVVEGARAVPSMLHLGELGHPRTSPVLRRSILPRGSRWHPNHHSGAGHLPQHAAPFTVPSGAQLPLCSKNQ